ncbi:prenyltransferase/squalene oxidase repeat-containing protein [Desulfitobacterium sp. Sab5]|uniref:prenyltransferase/squalene oxidase repeat-containing protein n=1 Tax=Desulfitobacterium nosdiversum TaxID=3375356 RepID=UPI003CF73D51
MELKNDIQESLKNAEIYVTEGIEQILSGNLDENHGVSPSPGATALGILALLAAGKGFENAQMRAVQWLKNNYNNGWGKTPGDTADEEITKIANMALYGSQGGWMAKIQLLSQVRQFSNMILSLGEEVVPGLEGPKPEEIMIPTILEDKVLVKLPLYGRPVVVAASLLASDSQEGIIKGIQYLLETQMPDGSWSEDIIATSLAILAITRKGSYPETIERAGRWLVQRQYQSGAWPAFDQLKTWAMGWAVSIMGEKSRRIDIPWFSQAVDWLIQGRNEDGSYGSAPPFTHSDFDDTAVALIGLHQAGKESDLSLKLLKELQNDDGSWGTFPSFQGKPPSISSGFPVYIPSVDVSIHVLEALWRPSIFQEAQVWRGLNWLLSQQDDEGAFPSSWFEGPIYSTAQAIELFSKWGFSWEHWHTVRQMVEARKKGVRFIVKFQNTNGGWGSVVETGLALSGLMKYSEAVSRETIDRGIKNLLSSQNSNGSFTPSYRAIYAKGWNYEEPLTTALTAIKALQNYQRLYQK